MLVLRLSFFVADVRRVARSVSSGIDRGVGSLEGFVGCGLRYRWRVLYV